MKKILCRKHASAQQLLGLIWILLTALFLIIVLSHQWQQYSSEKKKELHVLAQKAGKKFDNLIGNLINSHKKYALSEQALENCQKLLPLLQSITFNTPQISGVVISDNRSKILCSTLNKKYSLPPIVSSYPALWGPMSLDQDNQEIFLLQQPLGDYYYGLYIVKNVFEDLLKSISPLIEFAALYQISDKKFTLQVGESPLQTQTTADYSRINLQSLKKYWIILTANFERFQKEFLYHQVLVSLGILFISFLIYSQLRYLLTQRFSLNYALSRALHEKQFYPVYQPIRDFEQQRYCGAEVLLRWHLDDENMIMPEIFIDEAEKSGLIVPITLEIIAKAFQQNQLFLQQHSDFYLSFNFSACHFEDHEFILQFYSLCDQYQIQTHQLIIELTERELLDQNNLHLIAQMKELRTKGYSLAIDDFGTGHASIKYLQHFPFNYLKIDKLFIHAIGTGAINESLNQAIIHLVACLNLEIIAEGVETKEQVAFLQESKIRFMQGWYFAKAMSHDELKHLIEEDLK